MGAVDSPTDLELRDGVSGRRLDERLERLAAGHPSSPDYPDRQLLVREAADVADEDGDADRVRPYSDAEHAEHVAEVEVRLDDARAAGLSTDLQHTVDEEREVWMRGPANDFHWRVARPHNPRNAWQLYFHINPEFYGRNWKISQILRIPVTEPAQVAPVRPHTCLRGVSYREASHLSGK